MVLPILGKTRPGGPLPRPLNYQSDLLFHLRAADVLLGHDPSDDVARAVTGEAPTFTRASAGGYTRDALGFLTQWGQAIPRIKMYDLDGDGYFEEPGLLIESARTNAFTKSIELNDGAWTKIRATVSANAIEAPDRTVTADKLVEDATAGDTHDFRRDTPALSNDTLQAFSLFAKAAGRSEIRIRLNQKDATDANVWFDLSAGTVGTADGGAVGLIEKYADGWYRCMLIADSASGGGTPSINVFMGSGSETHVYNGDSTSGVYFWGMQFEVDEAFPSSFLLTAASTTARSADALEYALVAWLGQAITVALDDLTIYLRMPRPFHADVTTVPDRAGLLDMSEGVSPDIRAYMRESEATVRAILATGVVNATATVAYPAGTPLEVLMQAQDVRVGGSLAIDNGDGLSAFGSAGSAISAWGGTVIQVGRETVATRELDGAIFDLKIARGLRTMKQMQEAF